QVHSQNPASTPQLLTYSTLDAQWSSFLRFARSSSAPSACCNTTLISFMKASLALVLPRSLHLKFSARFHKIFLRQASHRPLWCGRCVQTPLPSYCSNIFAGATIAGPLAPSFTGPACSFTQHLFHLHQQLLAGERLWQIGPLAFLACRPHITTRAKDSCARPKLRATKPAWANKSAGRPPVLTAALSPR